MRFDVVTLFPEMVQQLADHGVVGRALRKDVTLQTWNPRDHATDTHRRVDDRPYGGGPGMVMQFQPVKAAIDAAKAAAGGAKVIYLSPQGRRMDQGRVQELASAEGHILLCGRYEGIDERVIDACVDEELSVGDYVLSGGELAAMVLIDAVTRLLPGSLGDDASAEDDSFSNGLLDCPHYTRPEQVQGLAVPSVLLGGDHEAIRRWRLKEALRRTWERRPDLLDAADLDEEQQRLLDECKTNR